MDLISALRSFTRVAETGSFTAVAREQGSSQSAVTRQIAQLEEHFGVRLFHRTTRRISLTDDGDSLLAHARQLLDYAESMEAELGRHSASPTGLVRVGIPVAASLFLAPRMPTLLAEHPGLAVEFVVRDGFSDMIEDRLDLALQSGEIADSSLVVRTVGMFGRVAVAAPSYLEARGMPASPSALTDHVCVVHDNGPDAATWRFTGPDGPVSVRVGGPFMANNSQAVHAVSRAGHGIALLPEVQVIDDIRSGRLIRLLSDYPSQQVALHLLYPTRRNLAPRTRVVMDFLLREIRISAEVAARVGEGIVDPFWA
ncbi:MAG: LysR family transcriptional regulator [Rhodospirillales bacterium 69-11]|nr:LysR family transcriptional regulator [Rhodospirillales bacterium]OJW19768.1 MAG: LysR family transcriptional regulator [Rhodospirillales bacterium 69-11]